MSFQQIMFLLQIKRVYAARRRNELFRELAKFKRASRVLFCF